jgi:extracellular elastinolytic metalloproteinase
MIEDALDATYNGHAPTLEYLVQSAGGPVALSHVVQVQNGATGAWYEAYADAHTGKLLSVTDFVADAAVRGSMHGFGPAAYVYVFAVYRGSC